MYIPRCTINQDATYSMGENSREQKTWSMVQLFPSRFQGINIHFARSTCWFFPPLVSRYIDTLSIYFVSFSFHLDIIWRYWSSSNDFLETLVSVDLSIYPFKQLFETLHYHLNVLITDILKLLKTLHITAWIRWLGLTDEPKVITHQLNSSAIMIKNSGIICLWSQLLPEMDARYTYTIFGYTDTNNYLNCMYVIYMNMFINVYRPELVKGKQYLI